MDGTQAGCLYGVAEGSGGVRFWTELLDGEKPEDWRKAIWSEEFCEGSEAGRRVELVYDFAAQGESGIKFAQKAAVTVQAVPSALLSQRPLFHVRIARPANEECKIEVIVIAKSSCKI